MVEGAAPCSARQQAVAEEVDPSSHEADAIAGDRARGLEAVAPPGVVMRRREALTIADMPKFTVFCDNLRCPSRLQHARAVVTRHK
jgi:hypothetical protein